MRPTKNYGDIPIQACACVKVIGVLFACPQLLQMYTWWHNKVLELIIELLRAQCETANQQSITAKEPIIQFLKEGECPVRKQKNPMKRLNGTRLESFSGSQDISTISSSRYSNRKAAGHYSMVRFKKEENREEAHKQKKKPLRDTVCRPHGNELDIPCDSFWGWLSWF